MLIFGNLTRQTLYLTMYNKEVFRNIYADLCKTAKVPYKQAASKEQEHLKRSILF
jgi:hypothetical protein